MAGILTGADLTSREDPVSRGARDSTRRPRARQDQSHLEPEQKGRVILTRVMALVTCGTGGADLVEKACMRLDIRLPAHKERWGIGLEEDVMVEYSQVRHRVDQA